MAFADGNIIIGTSVDVGGIDTGLHKIQKSFKRLGRFALTTIGVGAFAKLGKAAIDAASDLQEVQNVVDVAFKDMSYKIEEFSKICIEHFGISEFAAKQTSGSFMAMAKAIGITKETASDMAVELTGLTGDFASFYNISQEYARVAISSIFTGETETIKRYGIILTEANLQEYALTEGITKKVKAMSAAEKALLRYNYVMKATQMLHGDFERTQNNWANSVRVLKEQWHALMIEMGTVFMQKVQPIIGVLNTIITKLIAIFKYMQELLGITSQIGEATFTDEMEDMADAVDDVGKAIKHQLAPFDKLNNLTSKAGSGVDDDMSDLEKLYEKAKLSGYVIEAMQNFETQVIELSESVKKKLANMVNLFRRAKFKIESLWNNIKLNHWFSAGMDFGDMIASLEKFISDSISGVDWQKKGEEIGEFFKGIIWSDALGGFVDVLISALDAVVTLALAGLNKISIEDVIQMAKNYSKAAKKFFKWIYNTLKKVNWTDLGKKLGTFIENIDWGGVFEGAIEVIFEAFKSAVKFYKGVFDGAPIATTLITGIVAAFKIAEWTGLSAALTKSFKKSLIAWKKGIAGKDGVINLSSSAGRVFQGALGTITLGLSVGLAIEKWNDIKSGELQADSLKARLEDLGSAIGAAFGVKLAAGAFGVTMGPAGLLLTLAGALAVNLTVDAILDPDDETKREQARKRLRSQLESLDWFKDFTDTIDVMVELQFKIKTELEDVDAETSYYEEIARKWLELSQTEGELTDTEANLLHLYSEELVSYFPDLVGKIDSVTGAYQGTAESLQLIIDKTKELMKLEVYKTVYEQYKDEIAAAEKARIEFEQRLEELKTKYSNAKEYILEQSVTNYLLTAEPYAQYFQKKFKNYPGGAYAGLVKDVEQKIKDAFAKGEHKINLDGIEINLDYVKVDWDETLEDETFLDLDTAIKESEKELDRYGGHLNTLYEQMDRIIVEQSVLEDSIRNKDLYLTLEKLGEAFNGVLADVDDTWKKQINDAITAVHTKLEEGETISSEDMQRIYMALNGGLSGLPEGSLPQDVQTTLDDIKGKLEAGEITYREAMRLVANAMVSGFDEGLGDETAGTGLYALLAKHKEKTLKAIEAWKKDVTNASKKALILGLYDASTKKAEEEFYNSLSDSDKAKYQNQHNMFKTFGGTALLDTLGKQASEGADEIRDDTVKGVSTLTPENRHDLVTGGNDMADTLLGGVKAPLKINSPSKVMEEEVAGNVIEGMVIGIKNGISAIIAAASEVVNALVSTFDAVQLTPTLTIVPQIDMANVNIPDIVNGMTVPVSVSTATNNTTVAGMTKKEFSELLNNALSNLKLTGTLDATPDEGGIFKSVKAQAKIFKDRTGNSAFA